MGNKKIGRPTKFNSTLETVAIALAEKGNIDSEIIDIVGVSESCFNEHKKRHPEFKKLLLEAKRNFDKDVVESALLARALGSVILKETQTRIGPDGKKTVTVTEKTLPPEPSCISLFLKNRDPEKWCREKQNLSVESVGGLTIDEAKTILSQDPFRQDMVESPLDLPYLSDS